MNAIVSSSGRNHVDKELHTPPATTPARARQPKVKRKIAKTAGKWSCTNPSSGTNSRQMQPVAETDGIHPK
jgi:hypothetical protein